MSHSRTILAAFGAAVATTLTLGVAPATADEPPGLAVGDFLGEVRIAPGTQYAGTTVGGLSGLDYDEANGIWYVVSDDRSALGPARFYTAELAFDATDDALSGVELTGTTPFRRADGSTYPPLTAGDGTTPDPEDIRVDPITGRLLWSQEGDRIVPTDGTAPTLIDPTVRFADLAGAFVRELPVQPEQRPTTGESGIRANLGPEGLTFAADGQLVVTALEGPLLQDGPAPTRTAGALSRIVVQDRHGEVVDQFAYPQEPIFADPTPADGFSNNGVTAILAIDESDPTQFLVVERSFVTGVGNKVRIYEVDTSDATDISDGSAPADAEPVQKRLVLDVADLPVESVDNIEGMAWGPTREDGSRTLVLVSDDNFAATQVTQFIAVALS